MFEEYGLTNIDSFSKKWERREIGLQMDNYTNKQFGRLTALFPVVIECKDNIEKKIEEILSNYGIK